MTISEFCEQGTLRSNGCLLTSIDIEGEPRPRIPYTPPYFGPDYENCSDCGAKFGRYHHPWYDMELCPCCNNQLISCDCVVTGLLKGVGPYRAQEQEIFKQFADTMNKLTDHGKRETDQDILRTELLKLKEWDNELIDIMIQGLNEDDIRYIHK